MMSTLNEIEAIPSPLEKDGSLGPEQELATGLPHSGKPVDDSVSTAGLCTVKQEPSDEDQTDEKCEARSSAKRTRRVGSVAARKAPRLDEVNAIAAEAVAAAVSENHFKVNSKHDEKWQKMLEKLLEYKEAHNGSTLVPQCYDRDPRLGRWVHYQRVEYWLYLSNQQAKINPERIARLNAIGFEWDPQRAQWDNLFERLKHFHAAFNHCKVPKGYTKDKELANWVRNQRLEYAQMQRGKKNRMTKDRLDLLNSLNFTWSTSMPHRSKPVAKQTKIEDGIKNEEDERVAADVSKEACFAQGINITCADTNGTHEAET